MYTQFFLAKQTLCSSAVTFKIFFCFFHFQFHVAVPVEVSQLFVMIKQFSTLTANRKKLKYVSCCLHKCLSLWQLRNDYGFNLISSDSKTGVSFFFIVSLATIICYQKETVVKHFTIFKSCLIVEHLLNIWACLFVLIKKLNFSDVNYLELKAKYNYETFSFCESDPYLILSTLGSQKMWHSCLGSHLCLRQFRCNQIFKRLIAARLGQTCIKRKLQNTCIVADAKHLLSLKFLALFQNIMCLRCF